MPKNDLPAPADIAVLVDGSEDELEDLATLDADATVEEVMTAVHWIEDHTPGLGADRQPVPGAPTLAAPAKPQRRRSSVVPPTT